jgi:glycosyltransferase involved in cell wall biosynthesis
METSETYAEKGSVAVQDKSEPMVSIVVPAFNEAARIGDSIRKIDRYMRNSKYGLELLIVDDGSSDKTAEIIKCHSSQRLRFVQNDSNHGKGYTVRQGVLAATGRYVLFTDADLSAPIQELDKLLEVATKEKVDIVIGSRALDRKYIERHQSRFREFGGTVFNLMVRLLLGLQLRDTQCGFKLFHRARSRKIFEQQTTYGFGFDPELLFLAKRNGLTIRETPVRWSHAEGSKVNLLRDGIRMFVDLVRIRWNVVIGRYS